MPPRVTLTLHQHYKHHPRPLAHKILTTTLDEQPTRVGRGFSNHLPALLRKKPFRDFTSRPNYYDQPSFYAFPHQRGACSVCGNSFTSASHHRLASHALLSRSIMQPVQWSEFQTRHCAMLDPAAVCLNILCTRGDNNNNGAQTENWGAHGEGDFVLSVGA